ncbi:putative methylenetetrahydrofolate reductase [Gracilariopsis chorda]|uniref:Putative methylenetetrahydrofolate reductase n=1 Tax=Gracilariopsis chorda TaxID=448386 RepID=A0A2V3J337_9FLOR|nr:putative methylenetetrahydrofolate reductase [Gracilariopsis chorda]|eukprot:PXF48794.1 putative methylenetetrahydrofolate reductase [Gracilariopsis chorda]
MTVTANGTAKPFSIGSDPNLRQLPKIADKIRQRQSENRPFFSFEYFPPKTETGVCNLYQRVERMTAIEPLFCDVTWGAGGSTSDLTLDLSGNIQKYLGVDVMMHLTCTNMPAGKVLEGLEGAKNRGIRNILALRGDPPAGKEWTKCEDGFEHGTDLVRFIRANYGDYFGICVAGYPEGHPAGFLEGKITYDKEMEYLKEKVDAGADFIITQMFYDVDTFLSFVRRCRDIGITVPILPGILPIQNYTGFKRMTGFCRTFVPQSILDAMEPIKDDDVAVKEFGIRLGIDMCRRILKSQLCPGIHFYTLNLENSVMGIIDNLNLIPRTESIRSLPWRPATIDKRRNENVRPIFWANRPKSYLDRTSTWDDFPNGRWSDNRSPAFGDLTDYHLLGGGGWASATRKADAAKRYGDIKDFDDVTDVFTRFQKGELKRLPWAETEELATETSVISAPLLWLNRNGLLTINSQPRVNAAPSSDVTVGWGSAGGYVYQKAYVEFFAKPEIVDALFEAAGHFPSLTIYATKANSDKLRTTAKHKSTCAVTWGVFPDREIVQPTIVDPDSFLVWKNEAFNVWTNVWADLYNEGSPSRAVLNELKDSLYLVNVVDNDYVGGDIFGIFKMVLAQSV